MIQNTSYLTTREVAELLRLKERKIYDLVAEGGIPCVRVTGKLLFPRDLIEAWLARNLEFGEGVEGLKVRPPIVAGSHDPLLDWAIRESGSGLAVSFGGSLDGVGKMARGEAMLAGAHLADESMELGEGWNIEAVRRRLTGQPVVVIEWAKRMQGLIVAEGNPLGISGVSDLKRARLIGRQQEAGAFVLLQRLAQRDGVDVAKLKLCPQPARTESDVAAAVADGQADAGIAIEAVAKQYRLGFVPLIEERYDLIIWRRDFFDDPVDRLMRLTRTKDFRERAMSLGGYDVSGSGRVHYNGA